MSTVKLRPGISLCFKEGCISVGKDVIRALGEPRYISILKNDEKLFKESNTSESCTDKILCRQGKNES